MILCLMYPLMDAQLSHYIDKGRAWKYLPDKNIGLSGRIEYNKHIRI